MKTPALSHSLRASGFSLAETVIAVGITASTIVTLVGMIPLSLNTLHRSGVVTAEARITQAIAADYRMREWSEVVQQQQEGGCRDFSFDGQGTRVKQGDASTIFTARVTVSDALPLPGMQQTNPRLKNVQILVTSSPDATAAFTMPENCHKAQTLVAQTDKTAQSPPMASN
ncbi:MAG: Verru_Chthon cassette protein B [Prosthecobacter sp.]|uniref:Verru_Chthon cassette protein B n=1 Tax=Prosthecobacter sp. TaxID=1965333 RepID=UPI0025FEC3F4|nr:Verru_Chthon cassette protein B [Prosthecobacter sp.]MCF7786514.1 Verru_Chthon cassette protein B [Prosthecobacter sp.]